MRQLSAWAISVPSKDLSNTPTTPTAADIPADLRDALAGRYTLERELGQGGMATVYLAHDVRHERPVALKVLRAEQSAVLGAERFDREIKVLARLRHPFVLPLHDSGEAAGALYFVMPYVEGESLRARLARESTLPLEDVASIVRQIADALDYANGEGVIHRDVKPENILLSRHGHAMLADFGIARGALLASGAPAAGIGLTQSGTTIGTVDYMSPEQALGDADIDGRSDVYSLACVVYEALAGRPPFTGRTALSIVAQHIGVPAPSLAAHRADLSPSTIRAVSRALEKKADDRFPTATAFVQALLATETQALPAQTQLASTPRLSIAVLPVSNRSSDAETEYFSEGMTDELMNALAKVEGLRVVSRTSAFAFKSGDVPIKEIGARLGVGFVLEASVRRAGNRLRVTARLVGVEDDSTLWSETYERQLEDVFAVQDEITHSIVKTITGALQLGHLRGAKPVQQPRSLEAYDLYLLGRHHWYKRTNESMRRALELFQEAAAADPLYAPAYSGIADASALLASWQFATAKEMYPQAVKAAQRALELDPSLADAHASLGFVKLNWDRDWEGALHEFQRAIALNPSHEAAHRWLSAFLAGIGRDYEAMPIALRAVELDPISVLPRMNLGIVHWFAWRFEAAEVEFRGVIEKDPGFVRGYAFLACSLSFLNRHEEAISAARIGVEKSNRHAVMLFALGLCIARAGQLDEARAIFGPVVAELDPFYEAAAHAALGDDSAALDTLERALDVHPDWMYSVGRQRWFSQYHAHPRFIRLLEHLQLPIS
ncbi:MAG TPA: protein kinase [Gemmatimonadaceae bacterium]|nr:protein kinase [Gemmatimonadaceae bacterium]